MKRLTTLMLGTALAAALSFGAQTPSNPAPDASSKSAPVVKKHKKHMKKNAAANAAPASSTSSAPAKK
jgi:hypothetical protein